MLEYALILAVLAALVVGASDVMQKPLETFFIASVDQASVQMKGALATQDIARRGDDSADNYGQDNSTNETGIGAETSSALLYENHSTRKPDSVSSKRISGSGHGVSGSAQSDRHWVYKLGGGISDRLSGAWALPTIWQIIGLMAAALAILILILVIRVERKNRKRHDFE